MTELVVCLSNDEKTWGHVQKLIKDADWSSVYIITDEFCKNRFKADKKVSFAVVDFAKPASELISDIKNKLNGRFSDLEVALNLVSGNGKQHMAILSALLKAGVGVRLVAVTKDGVKEL